MVALFRFSFKLIAVYFSVSYLGSVALNFASQFPLWHAKYFKENGGVFYVLNIILEQIHRKQESRVE